MRIQRKTGELRNYIYQRCLDQVGESTEPIPGLR
jgi:hypothetical protein